MNQAHMVGLVVVFGFPLILLVATLIVESIKRIQRRRMIQKRAAMYLNQVLRFQRRY